MLRAWPGAALAALVMGVAIGDRLRAGPGTSALLVAGILAVLAVGLVAIPARVAGSRRAHFAAAMALVAVVGLGCALEQRARHGLVRSPLAGPARARADATVDVTLVDDPDGTRFTTRALARVRRVRVDGGRWRDGGGRTVLVVGESDAGPRLGVLAAGDRVVLAGWLRPLDGYDERLVWHHAAARFDAQRVVAFGPPSGVVARVANAVRGVILRGTASLPATERSLLAGFLLGDTRALPDQVVVSFRSAGLSHLLAVSGANVAFVLALVAPGLRRLRRGGRLVAIAVVLVLFGSATRWEPSVLRAVVMAGGTALAVHAGRPTSTLRSLALAATVLVAADPFLVHSVGFALSCGASLGIALGAVPLAARLPGPSWLRESLGTTLAAQLGVLPILLSTFDEVPLVTVPANLLAVPLAGPLTTWGLVTGALGGLLGFVAPGLARLLQVPTRVLADAVLGIADLAARVPLALDARAVVGLVGLFALGLGAVRWTRMLRGDGRSPFPAR